MMFARRLQARGGRGRGERVSMSTGPLTLPHTASALVPACSQSCPEQHRSRRRSCSRGGPQGQLDAAVAGVRHPWLEPAPKCSPFCQRPLTPSASASAPVLAVSKATGSVPKEELLSLWASRATTRCNRSSRPPGARTSSRVFAFVSAPIDTHSMPLLAVSTGTRFRSTSSRARSRPRRSTYRARGSALPPPSSSRAASRRTACSRS